jgi:hypothetical protein
MGLDKLLGHLEGSIELVILATLVGSSPFSSIFIRFTSSITRGYRLTFVSFSESMALAAWGLFAFFFMLFLMLL